MITLPRPFRYTTALLDTRDYVGQDSNPDVSVLYTAILRCEEEDANTFLDVYELLTLFASSCSAWSPSSDFMKKALAQTSRRNAESGNKCGNSSTKSRKVWDGGDVGSDHDLGEAGRLSSDVDGEDGDAIERDHPLTRRKEDEEFATSFPVDIRYRFMKAMNELEKSGIVKMNPNGVTVLVNMTIARARRRTVN